MASSSNKSTPGGANNPVTIWTHEELIKSIDTSNDIELLRACHNEMLRRRNAYYIWKQGSNTPRSTPSTPSEPDAPTATLPSYSEAISLPTSHQEYSQSVRSSEEQRFYDLTDWSTLQLQYTINSSNDTQLLRACRMECQHRASEYERSLGKLELKAMEDVEKQFLSRQTSQVAATAPSNLFQNVNMVGVVRNSYNNSIVTNQTYFNPQYNSGRMPQTNYNVYNSRFYKVHMAGTNSGWWYGHFSGQKICREMKITQREAPIMYIEGIHDALMCQVSLDETGLSHRGIEISLQEFEQVWERTMKLI